MTDTLEEDLDFLGLPSPTEIWKQQAALLEHEIAELNTQLRAARESIFKLTQMLQQVTQDRESALARLRAQAAIATESRNKAIDLEHRCAYLERTNEDLRRQIPVGPARYLR
ncbi:hypothetical protein [Pseudomonas asplenii]|uniref:hypothetical protein n=1 Tax=Pseudomonas asplenii TaxID=53407 RepID=UPI0006B62C1B|nr:hypothetical protein [Pseudomonas fuscovaginae]KPA98080.1 hypothetical protein PF70_01800 [Pseudomonas fuscovaginae]